MNDPIEDRLEMLKALSGRPTHRKDTGNGRDGAAASADATSGNGGDTPGTAGRRTPYNPRRRGRRPKRMKTRYDGRLDRSYRDPGAFNELVVKEIRRNGWSRNFAIGQLRSAWPEIVGENIAGHTRVVKYNEQKRHLHIESDSTAWATNLRLMQTTILQTIARRVGPDVVAELKIYGPKAPSWRHGPLHVSGRGPRDTYG